MFATHVGVVAVLSGLLVAPDPVSPQPTTSAAAPTPSTGVTCELLDPLDPLLEVCPEPTPEPSPTATPTPEPEPEPEPSSSPEPAPQPKPKPSASSGGTSGSDSGSSTGGSTRGSTSSGPSSDSGSYATGDATSQSSLSGQRDASASAGPDAGTDYTPEPRSSYDYPAIQTESDTREETVATSNRDENTGSGMLTGLLTMGALASLTLYALAGYLKLGQRRAPKHKA